MYRENCVHVIEQILNIILRYIDLIPPEFIRKFMDQVQLDVHLASRLTNLFSLNCYSLNSIHQSIVDGSLFNPINDLIANYLLPGLLHFIALILLDKPNLSRSVNDNCRFLCNLVTQFSSKLLPRIIYHQNSKEPTK